VKISLVATLLNEAPNLDAMLKAIDRQTRQPDEVVIVDGGSTDGSLEILRHWAAGRPNTRIGTEPGANISAGRNAAIRLATGEVIAVTDAGCTPEPGWLAALAAGFGTAGNQADVVMGFYAPDPRTRFERILSCLNLPDASEVDPESFMPSSRSVAFRREVWERAGGYPEWLAIGEDMYFNFQVLRSGARRRFAPEAVVRWRLRPDLRSTLRQYFRYAEGDGRAGMYPRRHALRFGTYAGAALLLRLSGRRPVLLGAIPPAVAVRMLAAYRRAFRRLDRTEAALSIAALPGLELLIDLAKMAGYVSGRVAGRPEAPEARS
jgi:glycosyltransferase involved in cell wall biosynthesis